MATATRMTARAKEMATAGSAPRKRAAMSATIRKQMESNQPTRKRKRSGPAASMAASAAIMKAVPRGMVVVTPELHHAAIAAASAPTDGTADGGGARAPKSMRGASEAKQSRHGPLPLDAFRQACK